MLGLLLCLGEYEKALVEGVDKGENGAAQTVL